MAEFSSRGVQFQALGGGSWELVTWVEQESFRPRRLGPIKQMCASLSKYLGDVFLNWESLEVPKLPAKAQKRFFGVSQVTPRLWVGPPGTKVELKEAQSLLELEIGQAMHCGLEPASRSTLLLLGELLSKERITTALDVKTGTGIFSMAAALWGVEKILALDPESNAARAARNNLKRNNLTARVKVKCISVKKIGGRYDLVIATAPEKFLMREMKHILKKVGQGGWLLVGGLWHRHVEGFLSRCTPPFSLEARRKELWWESLLLKQSALSSCTRIPDPGSNSNLNKTEAE